MIDMSGTVGGNFITDYHAKRTSYPDAGYVKGRWQKGEPYIEKDIQINLQPLSDNELEQLSLGAERVIDSRNIRLNSGDLNRFKKGDIWNFSTVDGDFKVHKMDIRDWHKYCKITAIRIDK